MENGWIEADNALQKTFYFASTTSHDKGNMVTAKDRKLVEAVEDSGR